MSDISKFKVGNDTYNIKDEEAHSSITALAGRVTSAETAIAGKVDKVAGKGLSTNDYDDTEKGKVAANTGAIEAMSEYEPNDITSRLSNLTMAISEGNLAKYGYKIGDYFDGSVSGYRYWLGQLDYNYGGYNSYAILGSHNIGLVVDTKSYSQWNTTDDTTGGGENCALQVYLRGTVLDNIKAHPNASNITFPIIGKLDMEH